MRCRSMKVTKILVTKYGSENDRDNQKDGIVVGEATSYDEFVRLVGKSGHVFLGYTDESDQALHYQRVEQRFGRRMQHTYTYYDELDREW